jgi:hypothetical protein
MKTIEAMKVHKGRAWHAIAERRPSGGVATWCNRIIMDSWAEYADDYFQCKEAGWKPCVKCDRNVMDVVANGN